MVQIKQKDKRTGIVYVYEAEGGWNKELKQTRYTNRKLIGHIDPETGDVVSNRPTKAREDSPSSRRTFVGTKMLLDQVALEVGVDAALKAALPHTWDQVLSLAYYLVAEDKSPLFRYARFAATHATPYGFDIPSQRSSELLASIDTSVQDTFCGKIAALHGVGDRLFYDTTSISSYSESLSQVKWGHNKDHMPLAQINLAMLVGRQSGIPLYYRKVAGNIADVSTVRTLIGDMQANREGKVHLVMDRGFWSKANIDAMMREHYKFLIGGKKSLAMFKRTVDECSRELRSWENYDEGRGLFGLRLSYEWPYEETKKRTGKVVSETRRSYVYLYFSPEAKAKDERAMASLLKQCAHELEANNRIESHESYYDRFFSIVRNKVVGNVEAIEEAGLYDGYFYLFSNEVMEPTVALDIYSSKDAIEKCFGDAKHTLDFRTQKVSSVETLNGKLFVLYVALVLTSWLRRKMRESELDADYTLQGLIDEVDTIECYEQKGHRPRICEVTQKQRSVFEKLGYAVPGMS